MDDVVRYIVSPNAAHDTEDILRYLTREAGTSIAQDVEDKLFSLYDKLARVPVLGHRRSDLTDRAEFRFYLVKPYMIVFQRTPTKIIIHAVLHGARDVKDMLNHRASCKNASCSARAQPRIIAAWSLRRKSGRGRSRC